MRSAWATGGGSHQLARPRRATSAGAGMPRMISSELAGEVEIMRANFVHGIEKFPSGWVGSGLAIQPAALYVGDCGLQCVGDRVEHPLHLRLVDLQPGAEAVDG